MATSRTILIAGAGIGGLTAALALARAGFRIVIAEQAERLSDIGAGIQLSPNATRILQSLGVAERLAKSVLVPNGLSIRSARSGAEIAFMPIGAAMEFRYGAPYWIVHRADLQVALADAVAEQPDVALKLGTRLEDVAMHANGITAQVLDSRGVTEERAAALVGADGSWSTTRARLGATAGPQFRFRAAWRATLAAESLPAHLRTPLIRLWLGHDAHIVFYPLRGGLLVNMVAIVHEPNFQPGWSSHGKSDALFQHFAQRELAQDLRELLRLPDNWSKWALFDSDEVFHGTGPVALIGDAAHPMLPFLAQGAAMAIEDAAVLARCLASPRVHIEAGMRRYEAMRTGRVRRVHQAARGNGRLYHLSGPAALARNLAMRLMGGERLRARYDWIYDWRPD